MRRGKKWDAAYDIPVPFETNPREAGFVSFLLLAAQADLNTVEKIESLISTAKNGTATMHRDLAKIIMMISFNCLHIENEAQEHVKSLYERASKAWHTNHPDSL